MKPISSILPHSPELEELVLAKDQKPYLPLPVAVVHYQKGEVGMISCYRLNLSERLKLLFTGKLWIEQLTAGQLQPQRPTVYEPLSPEDERYDNYLVHQG